MSTEALLLSHASFANIVKMQSQFVRGAAKTLTAILAATVGSDDMLRSAP